jgi:hypothetical protein
MNGDDIKPRCSERSGALPFTPPSLFGRVVHVYPEGRHSSVSLSDLGSVGVNVQDRGQHRSRQEPNAWAS